MGEDEILFNGLELPEYHDLQLTKHDTTIQSPERDFSVDAPERDFALVAPERGTDAEAPEWNVWRNMLEYTAVGRVCSSEH